VIATCRRVSDGGGFAGAEEDRLALLAAAAAAGAAWVDVEHDVPEPALGALRPARLLRSIHVSRLPEDVHALADVLMAAPADAGKLVALEGDARDALRLLRLVAAHRGRLAGHVVAQRFTRFASCLLGAPLAYAALRPGGRIGLDLPTVPEMLDTADLVRARPGTRAWVLTGRDVEASVSPQMLNAAFRAAGDDIVALRWSTDDPEAVLAALETFDWAGAAVTIPHKEAVHAALVARGATLGPAAAATGAVNTVLWRGGVLSGHNTDLGGLGDALDPSLPREAGGGTALVLGAGGAARAAVLTLRRRGLAVTVWARRPEAAAELEALGARPVGRVDDALREGPGVVVDATPAGPPGGESLVDPALLPRPAVVLDMLVSGRPTALSAAAAAAGHVVVPGLAMLAGQAARQVELLTGTRPNPHSLAAVGDALLHARERDVVLLGLRCSGKTMVGKRLAALLERPFVDVDAVVTDALGRSPDELIRDGEEDRFRAAERDAMRALAGGAGRVVATGGGAALGGAAFDALCDGAYVVLLDASDEVLLRRLGAEPRAALTSLPPHEELSRQRSERMPMYESRSHRTERTDVRDEGEIADSIAAFVVRESTAPTRSSSVPS
jgi:shikimate 5-dehydrogenase/shikimate kinase